MLSRLTLMVFGLAVALWPTAASAERRVALVIGNSAYQHATALRNPGNDANDVAEALRKLGLMSSSVLISTSRASPGRSSSSPGRSMTPRWACYSTRVTVCR